MHKTHAKRRRDIKNKLMAAICMLLVSSIMMVSTTYAWFTLSTAPEVTGINTAVGANGNLEMALMPKTGLLTDIHSAAGDSILDIEARNITWGNLVDVSDNSIYGLDQIVLYPAALNLSNDGKINVEGSILKTPAYGADGRVSNLLANSVVGYFDNENTNTFVPNSDKGVRAVGTASGMTPRQLSYRNARAAANTARAQAANMAAQSLNANGSALANLAVKYAMDGSAAVFDKTDVAALRAMVTDLRKTGGVMDQIETAYMQYILAYAASQATGETDVAWETVQNAVNAEGADLDSVIDAIGEENLDAVMTGINAYKTSVEAVERAHTKIEAMETTLASNDTATFDWETIKAAMLELADPDEMYINEFKAVEAKQHLGDIVAALSSGGLKVIMYSGAGVYADIADQSGDYTASVRIEDVEYQGTSISLDAKMHADSTLDVSYLPAVGTAVEGAGAPENAGGTTMPISDTYGYIIDLAFRTNAAESELRLQQIGIDRIYADGAGAEIEVGTDPTTGEKIYESTMGHGASMTFMGTTLSNDQVKGLMDSIELVFFNPTDGTIYCYGGLDTANATIGVDGVTAYIYTYEITGNETVYTPATYAEGKGDNYWYTKTTTTEPVYTAVATNATFVTGTDYYVKDADANTYTLDATVTAETFSQKVTEGLYTMEEVTEETYNVVTDAVASQAAASNTTLYIATAGTPVKTPIANNKIMSLTQNTATALSVLVYLNGEKITNSNVAAVDDYSMTGTMNLQFSSSANLVPMEYADLHIPGAASESTGTGSGESTDETTTPAESNGN